MTDLEKKYLPTKLAGYVGFVVQAIVNNFLPILFIVFQDIYGLGYEKLGRLIVFNFATQLFIDLLTPKIVEKIGYRRASFLSQFAAFFGPLYDVGFTACYGKYISWYCFINYRLCYGQWVYGGYFKPND
jgi:fucose permease